MKKKKKFKFNDLKKVITYKRVAFLSILIGVGIMAVFVYLLLAGNYKFSGKELSLESIDLTYKVGSFLGAVIGPFWTLAGVFLYYTALKYQKDEIKKSQEAAQIQSFENTFFNLLSAQQELKSNLEGTFFRVAEYEPIYFKVQGGDFFKYSKYFVSKIFSSFSNERFLREYAEEEIDQMQVALDYYQNKYEHNDAYNDDQQEVFASIVNSRYRITKEIWLKMKKQNAFEVIKRSYEIFFKKHHHEVGHYFRHLYNILKFIEFSEEDFKTRDIKFDHKKYANFVQAQMSSFELMLLFYNVLLFPKAKRLVLNYGVLDNLAKEDLINACDYFEETGIKLKTRDELLFS